MDSHKISVKFFADIIAAPSGDIHFVPVFHRWIQTQAVADHLLVDVADYAHVHHGPGAVLIALEANFSTDQTDGHFGLMYVRKQPVEGSFVDRLRQAFAATLAGCKRLEEDPELGGRVHFRTDEALLRINDRLLAPNTAETFEAVRGELQQFLSELYGAQVDLTHSPDAQRPFEVQIRAGASPSIADLLNRLSIPPVSPPASPRTQPSAPAPSR
jgi:hypothetical protein